MRFHKSIKHLVRLLSRIKERRIISMQNSSRVFGLILTLLGLTPVIIVLSNAWISGVSFLDLSSLYEFLWSNRFNVGFGIGFQLFYLVIAGAVVIILGVFLLARKTERVEEMTVMAEDLRVTLECTNCRYQWKEEFSKTQLQSMGFPQNRRISRRRCPDCRKFTRPRIIRI